MIVEAVIASTSPPSFLTVRLLKPIEVGGQASEYYVSIVDGTPVAYAVKSTTVGFGGPLVLMVGITADGVVYNTSVLSHNETPGLGAKCNTDEKFTRRAEQTRLTTVRQTTIVVRFDFTAMTYALPYFF